MRSEDIFKCFSEFIHWVIRIKMIFFELLKDDKNEQVQENESTDNNERNPKGNGNISS